MRVTQLELHHSWRDLNANNTAFQLKLKELQDKCDAVRAENKWPEDVTCTAKTAVAITDLQQLLVTPIKFFEPVPAPKPEPKNVEGNRRALRGQGRGVMAKR